MTNSETVTCSQEEHDACSCAVFVHGIRFEYIVIPVVVASMETATDGVAARPQGA